MISLWANGRLPGWSYLGNPAVANNSPGALMRFTTARSWLSQWSLATAQVDAACAAPRVTVPVLVVVNGRDDAVPTSHPRQVYDAIGHDDKRLIEITDANHYFNGTSQRAPLAEAADVVYDWLRGRDLGGAVRCT